MTFDHVGVESVERWWDERPCNVGHSDAEIGSPRYSLEVTRTRYEREPHNRTFPEFERWRGLHVFEVGCGIGTDALEFARHGARVTAIDVSQTSLMIARLRAETEHLADRIRFVKHDVEQPISYDVAGWIDLIYSYGSLHHTPHPDVALRNLREVAKPWTELRIMLYHRWSIKGIRLGITNRRIARGSEARSACPVTYAYSRREARQLLDRTGWHVTEMRVTHILKRGLFWRAVPDQVRVTLARYLGWHLLIVARPK